MGFKEEIQKKELARIEQEAAVRRARERADEKARFFYDLDVAKRQADEQKFHRLNEDKKNFLERKYNAAEKTLKEFIKGRKVIDIDSTLNNKYTTVFGIAHSLKQPYFAMAKLCRFATNFIGLRLLDYAIITGEYYLAKTFIDSTSLGSESKHNLKNIILPIIVSAQHITSFLYRSFTSYYNAFHSNIDDKSQTFAFKYFGLGSPQTTVTLIGKIDSQFFHEIEVTATDHDKTKDLYHSSYKKLWQEKIDSKKPTIEHSVLTIPAKSHVKSLDMCEINPLNAACRYY